MQDQQKLWDSIWGKHNTGKVNDFARKSLSFINIKNKPFKTILDFGCGLGADSIYFAQRGFEVTAVDFSQTALKHLEQTVQKLNLNNIHIIQADLRNFKLSSNSFDVIYSHLSLHYFDDKTTSIIFDNLYKVLKPNGLFFVKCKSIKDPLYGQGEKIEDDMYILNGHIRHFFSLEYMKKKLHKFKIIKIKETSSVYYDYPSHFIEAIATKE